MTFLQEFGFCSEWARKPSKAMERQGDVYLTFSKCHFSCCVENIL